MQQIEWKYRFVDRRPVWFRDRTEVTGRADSGRIKIDRKKVDFCLGSTMYQQAEQLTLRMTKTRVRSGTTDCGGDSAN